MQKAWCHRRVVVWLVMVVGVVWCLGSGGITAGAGQSHDKAQGRAVALPTQPNVVLILTDDQRWDTLWAMPIVQDKLVARGVTFTQAFVTTPLCCPVRASVLSGGLYAHNTGVLSNFAPNGGPGKFRDTHTMATRLQEIGYHTMLVGKYLNKYEDVVPPTIPPGWTRFAMTIPQRDWYHLSVLQGRSTQEPRPGQVVGPVAQYITDFERDQALDFLDRYGDKPFFLYFSPHAPHLPAVAAPGDEGLFSTFLYRDRAYAEADLSDKPVWIPEALQAVWPVLGSAEADQIPRQQLQSLQAVDRAVGAIVESIAAKGKLGQTIFIFTSDNGYLWGEHGLLAKGRPYEESIRVPLVMVVPGVAPRTDKHLVAMNLDVPQTIFDLVGIAKKSDGMSLMPLLREQPIAWRQRLFLESFNSRVWVGVRTRRWKYIEYASGEEELYDLRHDPYEMASQHNVPQWQQRKAALRAQLARQKGLAVTTSGLFPAARVQRPYAVTVAAWGGLPPYTWKVVGGQLPAGLSLDSARGRIRGVPLSVGVGWVSLQVTDASLIPYTRQPQSYIKPFCLAVTDTTEDGCTAPFGGSVTGVQPFKVRCSALGGRNQSVQFMPGGKTSWDCEAAGLLVYPGTSVKWDMLRGQVEPALGDVGGTVTGIFPEEITCSNLSTGQQVTIVPDGAMSWNCQAAGLVATPGNEIAIQIRGIVSDGGTDD